MPKRRPRPRIKVPPLLFEATQATLNRIQRRVDGRFLSYWTSASGSVCDNDVMALHEILQGAGPQPRLVLFDDADIHIANYWKLATRHPLRDLAIARHTARTGRGIRHLAVIRVGL